MLIISRLIFTFVLQENYTYISTDLSYRDQLSTKPKERFQIAQVEGYIHNNKVRRYNCIFEDFSHHITTCVPYDEFIAMGYGYENILYPENWNNVTHRQGNPCVCMCNKGYDSIDGKCVSELRVTLELAKKWIKNWGAFPIPYFIMCKFNILYIFIGFIMTIIWICFIYNYFAYRHSPEETKYWTATLGYGFTIILIWLINILILTY